MLSVLAISLYTPFKYSLSIFYLLIALGEWDVQLSNISPISRVCSVMVARDIWVIEEAFESHIFYCTVSVSGLARKSVDLQGRVRVPYRTFSHIQQTKKQD